MTEIIVTPDTEQLFVDWLDDDSHITVPVGTKVPDPRPASFVRLFLTGGAGRKSLVISQPTLTFEAWADLESDALALILLIQGLVLSLPGQTIAGVPIYRIQEFAEPVNLPDPSTTQARYTYTASIGVRASAI